MTARLCFSLPLTALVLAACSTLDLNTTEDCKRYLSARDIREIRALVMSRPDIRKPLWGLSCHDGRVVASTGGRPADNHIGNFITLVRRNGRWQIIKIEEGPVQAVEISG